MDRRKPINLVYFGSLLDYTVLVHTIDEDDFCHMAGYDTLFCNWLLSPVFLVTASWDLLKMSLGILDVSFHFSLYQTSSLLFWKVEVIHALICVQPIYACTVGLYIYRCSLVLSDELLRWLFSPPSWSFTFFSKSAFQELLTFLYQP